MGDFYVVSVGTHWKALIKHCKIYPQCRSKSVIQSKSVLSRKLSCRKSGILNMFQIMCYNKHAIRNVHKPCSWPSTGQKFPAMRALKTWLNRLNRQNKPRPNDCNPCIENIANFNRMNFNPIWDKDSTSTSPSPLPSRKFIHENLRATFSRRKEGVNSRKIN